MISDADIVARLLCAAFVGSLIGFERERLTRAAGIRTHMLVCVGAALVTIVSAYGFTHATTMPHVILDPSRIAAQVVSGIGFLGAGAIMSNGGLVRGMTSAASIWAVAALGLAAGSGVWVVTAAGTVIILVTLFVLRPLEDLYRARTQSYLVTVRAEPEAVPVSLLKTRLGVHESQIRRIASSVEDGLQVQRVSLTRVSHADIRRGADLLRGDPGVQSVDAATARHRHGDGV